MNNQNYLVVCANATSGIGFTRFAAFSTPYDTITAFLTQHGIHLSQSDQNYLSTFVNPGIAQPGDNIPLAGGTAFVICTNPVTNWNW